MFKAIQTSVFAAGEIRSLCTLCLLEKVKAPFLYISFFISSFQCEKYRAC